MSTTNPGEEREEERRRKEGREGKAMKHYVHTDIHTEQRAQCYVCQVVQLHVYIYIHVGTLIHVRTCPADMSSIRLQHLTQHIHACVLHTKILMCLSICLGHHEGSSPLISAR